MRNVSYSFAAFDEPEALILEARQRLAGIDYDTMVGRGLSGALVVPILARALHKKWAIVRKPGDSTHSRARFEGEIGKRWLFVDDFTASGGTYRATFEAVHDAAEEFDVEVPKLVGAYLYDVGDPDSHEGLFTTAHMPA